MLVFGAVRDAHLAGQTSVPNTPQLTPLFPAITPLINTAVGLGLPGNSVVVAWSMQTQSISNVLDVIDATATARPAGLISAGITTAQLGLGLPGIASIYTGFIEVPYYGDPANPLTSFWVSSALAPPNVQNPTPIPRVPNRRIPLLATLPNAGSGHTQPGSGWPVVIFQHGITLNRTVMFAMADAFAQAGFAVVAIDLPLHGVTDTASPFYQGANSPFGNNERHFNLDNVGATGIFTPDGQIDNGWQILNVGNPLNARDHIRQAVADSIALTRTLPGLNFPDGDANPDLDGNRIHFVGSSLGSIISGVFLGVDTDVVTATLSEPRRPMDLDPDGPASHRLRRPDPRRAVGAGLAGRAPSASTTSSATSRRSSTPSIRSTTPPTPRRTIRCTSSRCSATQRCRTARTTTSRSSGDCRRSARRRRWRRPQRSAASCASAPACTPRCSIRRRTPP